MYLLAGLPGDSTISPLKEIVEHCDASVFENDILKHMVSLPPDHYNHRHQLLTKAHVVLTTS